MSLIVAAFETSSPISSVALMGADGHVAQRIHTGARGHVEFCIPALQEMLAETGLALDDLDLIATGIGPGLFTGLRVGVQTAKTLAASLERPLVGVSSLHALAASDPGGDTLVMPCMQAHRGEVFAAVFERDGIAAKRITEDAPMSPADALALAESHGATLLGNGPSQYAGVFGRTEVPVEAPMAAAVIALAVERFGSGQRDDPRTLEPLYARRSEAEIKWGDTGVVAKRPDRVTFKGSRT